MDEERFAIVDRMIETAFESAIQDQAKKSSLVAPLCELDVLFDPRFKTSLTKLANLKVPPRQKQAHFLPSLQVVVGVGKPLVENTNLHEFFTAMLEFESDATFSRFMKDGYYLVVRGGTHDDLVAAAAFIITPVGIFVDALAVSRGSHPHTCRLPGHVTTTFQKLGLGSFLMALLSRVAILRCTTTPAIYLKANNDSTEFYTVKGFRPMLAKEKLPPLVFRAVPNDNIAMDRGMTTMLVLNLPPRRPDVQADPLVEDAATLLNDLKGSGSQQSKSPAKRTRKQNDSKDSAPNLSKAQQKRARKKNTFAVESIPYADSDEETSPRDYHNHADDVFSDTYKPPPVDYYEPANEVYAKYKSVQPQMSHVPTQKEVIACYSGIENKALSRLKVLTKAWTYQRKTNSWQNSKTAAIRKECPINFSHQEYLDFAAVEDMNRPIVISTNHPDNTDTEVVVKVSSYRMPSGVTFTHLLADREARKKLTKLLRLVKVSLSWLVNHARPGVSAWIDESILGAKVQSLSGRVQRDKGFLSLPQGHKANLFEPSPPPSCNEGPSSARRPLRGDTLDADDANRSDTPGHDSYDRCGNATSSLIARMKLDLKGLDLWLVAPPPKASTQIVKLKWVPSKHRAHKNLQREKGVWHGVHAVSLGHDKSSMVLQECGLLKEWVEEEFSPAFLSECKHIAVGGHGEGKRNPKSFLFIPAGDAHDTDEDPPPTTELVPHVPVRYLQGNEDSCLRHSMASALDSMGFVREAGLVASNESLVGCTVELVERATVVVRKVFADAQLGMRMLHKHACSVEEMAKQDSTWPIVLILQTSDGSHGTHAVTTWNGMIYDSNSTLAMRWSQTALDWCSGKGSRCIGFSRAYQICPRLHGAQDPVSPISVGVQVRALPGTTHAHRWVMQLPNKKRKGCYLVRDTDGTKSSIHPVVLATLVLPWAAVGG
jgi:hypothetical protein